MCNDLRFPNFVANACCNPCCENYVSAQRVDSTSTDTCDCRVCIVPCCCGCCRCPYGNVGGVSGGNCGFGNVGGSNNDCGCGNVGGSNNGCGCENDYPCGNVGGTTDDDCSCGYGCGSRRRYRR